MKQPESFEKTGQERLVCKLKKRTEEKVNCLKQSPRCWNVTLDKYLGFAQLILASTFLQQFVIGDLCGKSVDRISKVIESLGEKFDVKNMGPLHSFLGMLKMRDCLYRSCTIETACLHTC